VNTSTLILAPIAQTAVAAAEPLVDATKRTYAGGIAHIRMQLEHMMDAAPVDAVERLLDAVIDGEIDGASYSGHTKCPLGWLGIEPSGPGSLPPNDTYLIEGFVFPVMPGETPETNGRLRRLERWVAVHLGWRYDAEREVAEAAAAATTPERAEAAG
jgi:hypothetical protein